MRKIRTQRARLALAAGVVGLLAAACVPPPAPGPEVRPQPDGRGRDGAVTVAPSAGCDAARPVPGRTNLTIETASGTRTAQLRIPESAAGDQPVPVLLSLHPFTADPTGWESYSGLGDAAAERGYVVITPKGSQPGPRWAVPGGLDTGIDDIAFVSALLDRVEDTLCVDRNRQFAAGFSAGAAMAQGLSCTMPWRFAAVAGSGGTNLTDLCPASPPTDVLVMHGTADPIAPLSGSDVVFAPPLGVAVDDVVATNAARAGCGPEPELTQPHSHVSVTRHRDCTGSLRVEYWSLRGAGHTWAGSAGLLDFVTGPTNRQISATAVVLDFFDGHTASVPA